MAHESPGILLLAMGGPSALDETETYLEAIFSDRAMVRMPVPASVQRRLARVIARRRGPETRRRYEAVGGKSPLLEETRKQADALERCAGWPVAVGMRHSSPGFGDGLAELRARGAVRIVAVPLFPQYSGATTGSALGELRRISRGMDVRVVTDHHAEGGYIEAVAARARAALRAGDHLLFAVHSLPRSQVRAGDPYVRQVEESARIVAERASVPARRWSLAFQSRVGPVRWQGPALDEELDRLTKTGARGLVVVPLSFVAENLETLFDLDIAFAKECRDRGIERFIRIPAVGVAPEYIEGLARLVRLEVSHE